jgi:hypothetical protein
MKKSCAAYRATGGKLENYVPCTHSSDNKLPLAKEILNYDV